MAERRPRCVPVRMRDTHTHIYEYIRSRIRALERLTGDQKVAGSIPVWGSETFF